MGDGETLLLVLVLLYLTDCFIWIRNQSVAFVSPWGRSWRVAFGDWFLGNERGSLLILNPLPPLGQVFLSHLSPVSLSAVGVCDFNPQSLVRLAKPGQSIRVFTFDWITSSGADGAHLVINEERFTKCATNKQAGALAGLINAARDRDQSQREALIRDYYAQQFDLDKAAGDFRKFRAEAKLMKIFCVAFFLFLFVATPILVNIYGLPRLILPLIILIVGFAAQLAIIFCAAHRRLFPKETQDRITSIIKMVLCPPAAIRATDILTRQLLAAYNPVVIAALLRGKVVRKFVRAYIRDLQHPLPYDAANPTAVEIISYATATQMDFCMRFLRQNDPSEAQALELPPVRIGGSAFYCPRCQNQFLTSVGFCPDCPGINLQAFQETHQGRA